MFHAKQEVLKKTDYQTISLTILDDLNMIRYANYSKIYIDELVAAAINSGE